MPYRTQKIIEGETYHVFNRSVNHENIFVKNRDIERFFSLINFYRYKSDISYSDYKIFDRNTKKISTLKEKIDMRTLLVEINAFCIMPNHFHFLIKPIQHKGISTFISKIQNAFAKYYNLKNKRHGSLFCGMFKAKLIKSAEQFNYISRYVHLNPVVANLVKITKLEKYPLTSFSSYMNFSRHSFLSKDLINKNFKTINLYKKYVFDQEDYLKKLNNINLE